MFEEAVNVSYRIGIGDSATQTPLHVFYISAATGKQTLYTLLRIRISNVFWVWFLASGVDAIYVVLPMTPHARNTRARCWAADSCVCI